MVEREDCVWDMIVLDIDGTLLDDRGLFRDDFSEKLERKGMVVSLASGRTPKYHPFINHSEFRGS